MDGRTDGRTDGRMDGWMDGWIAIFRSFQQYFSHISGLITKDCEMEPHLRLKRFLPVADLVPGAARSARQRLTYRANGAHSVLEVEQIIREGLPSVPFQIHSISGIKQYTIRMQKVASWNPRWTGQRLKTLQSAINGYFVKTGQQNLRKVRLWHHMLCPRYGRPLPYTVPMITRLQETCHCRVIARRIPGSTGFNIQ